MQPRLLLPGLQLMGVGRNEYIELMNRSKTGKGIFRKRVAPKFLLPTEPVRAVENSGTQVYKKCTQNGQSLNTVWT